MDYGIDLYDHNVKVMGTIDDATNIGCNISGSTAKNVNSALQGITDSLNILTNVINPLPTVYSADLPSQSTVSETFCKEWIDYMINNNKFKSNVVNIGNCSPNYMAWIIGMPYGTPKRYSSFVLHFATNSSQYAFGYSNGTWFYRTVTS